MASTNITKFSEMKPGCNTVSISLKKSITIENTLWTELHNLQKGQGKQDDTQARRHIEKR